MKDEKSLDSTRENVTPEASLRHIKLLKQIDQVVNFLSPSVLDSVIAGLHDSPSGYNEALVAKLLGKLPNPKFRRVVAELLSIWQQDQNNWNSCSLAAALSSAAYSVTQIRQALDVELVWTGPETNGPSFRRTDQVLLQLIRDAQDELTLISFAIYKIPDIAQVLIKALNRGVKVRLIAENPEVADKIPFGIKEALGKEIIERAQVFIWPKHKRPVDSEGRYGSLHIKSAIADSHKLFITSANLTQYAFTLNMEMGVLVRSRYLANQVESQIEDLIQHDVLVLI
ncbi:DISARM system phospholipase D-like protein DrmC [Pleurocapsa sp. PCC 7319]|uniref:DISARM system phospholipase D-like protein DrmC n=1 Tax=Pleurocapsa sp. PCC 7319 TaxID=118161 RepID=UPI00034567C9|nr:DISARM system phospholipase D-like protein DrmC [Pleurocapsa sp. PCC 7319]